MYEYIVPYEYVERGIAMNNNNTDECQYKVDAPYPLVNVDEPNFAYACEMLSNVGNNVSEMSDVSRYFYISVVAKRKYSSISKCFYHVSVVEMQHLNIFAELALLLGADPRLWCGQTRKRWWSPMFISYPHSMRELIAESIKAEEAAIRKYSRQANIICDTNIVSMLNRIILDEERHLQTFRDMYRNI